MARDDYDFLGSLLTMGLVLYVGGKVLKTVANAVEAAREEELRAREEAELKQLAASVVATAAPVSSISYVTPDSSDEDYEYENGYVPDYWAEDEEDADD
jgi:hypothetical protein